MMRKESFKSSFFLSVSRTMRAHGANTNPKWDRLVWTLKCSSLSKINYDCWMLMSNFTKNNKFIQSDALHRSQFHISSIGGNRTISVWIQYGTCLVCQETAMKSMTTPRANASDSSDWSAAGIIQIHTVTFSFREWWMVNLFMQSVNNYWSYWLQTINYIVLNTQ